jgi:hypothetical protein
MSEPKGSGEIEIPEQNSTSYRYRVTLRITHPNIDPNEITKNLTITPRWSWQAGKPRQTPKGKPLVGLNKVSYWASELNRDRWPATKLAEAIKNTLVGLERHRAYFNKLRVEQGSVQLLVGWFFDGQSGDVLTHDILSLAGDLQIDLSFDIYPSTQPHTD